VIEGLNCQIIGMEELQDALDKGIKQATRAALRRAAKEAVQPWLDLIVEKAPRNTGFLAEHIAVVTRFKDRGARLEMEIGPVKEAFYALFAEFGTHFQEAHPFLRPAFEEGQQDVLEGFAEAFEIELHQLETK
jgi:HK97 gp10 family phage protein